MLKAMFSNDTLEAKTGRIEVTAFSADALRTFLKFLCTGELGTEDFNKGFRHLFDVARAGDYYQVQELKDQALGKVQYYLSRNTAVDMIITAYKCGFSKQKISEQIFRFMTR
jgi:hypothetical protein